MVGMSVFLLVWCLSTLAVIGVLYLVKSLRSRRVLGLGEFHWPGLIVIALIAGAFPAFFYYNQAPRTVAVPDGVAERPNISQSAQK